MAVRPGRPTRRLVRVASPAAGAEWSRTNDSGRLWWIYALALRFVADANVATRTHSIRCTQDSDIWCILTMAQTQTTGLDRRLSGYTGASAVDSATAANRIAMPMDGLWLPPGEAIGSNTSGIQVGDQFSEIVLRLLELDDRAPQPPVPAPWNYPEQERD